MIEKTWINTGEEDEENFVVIHENVIYKLRAKDIEFNEVKYELNQGRLDKRLVGLPLVYLTSVIYSEGNKSLIFNYNKDSVDRIKINDNTIRKEIFDYLKDTTSSEFKTYVPHFFKRVKKPLIAFSVVLIAFLFVIMFIEEKKAGVVYKTTGLLAFLMYFAEFGIVKNGIGFGALLSLIGLKIWNDNIKYKETLHLLTFRKKK